MLILRTPYLTFKKLIDSKDNNFSNEEILVLSE